MKIIKLLLICILLCTYINVEAQIAKIGIGAGGGTIKGNSASVGALCGILFADTDILFPDYINIRGGFLFSRKAEYFLPENRTGRYYPFIKSFFIKAVTEQNLYGISYIEEGIGIAAINDRTFSDVDYWEPGITFGINAGIKPTRHSRFSIGIDYGLGLTRTNATYYSLLLSYAYQF
ncbi:hypothetical protein MROS_1574 [Melioribacter roseus P3M-2]|uniref:Outer membrane protein beta-barrel domain-containing protein n=1 Tax=Melioribacter roseus (strain DSM 23840 / JCM 17771 / VKM B-2668 / P3M-2) TaxID=1191523 RepID=I6Z6M0_MELRP|nr:hypothetical protein [Melioribacter roseus]AFN74810.1 hypothetical protein MROS_1574 [Melioribacter roseus P3M-2]